MSAPLNYVYFLRPIGAEGPVKIGQSRCPLIRLKAISSWSPVELEIAAHTPGARSLEARLHALFAKERLHGEWFSSSVALSALITDIQRGEFDADSLPSERVRGDSNWTDVSRFSVSMAAALRRVGTRVSIPDSVRIARERFAYGKWRGVDRHQHPDDARVVIEWLARHGEFVSPPADFFPEMGANDSSDREQAA